MKTHILFIFLILTVISNAAFSQDCAAKKVHIGECKQPFDIDYEDTGKSMSFPVYKGKTQKLVVTLAGKKDYYFTVCSDINQEISFKIRNANNPDEIIFDNTGFDHPQNVEFSMLFSNKLLFEITVPLIYGSDNDGKPVCVGMLLFQKDS